MDLWTSNPNCSACYYPAITKWLFCQLWNWKGSFLLLFPFSASRSLWDSREVWPKDRWSPREVFQQRKTLQRRHHSFSSSIAADFVAGVDTTTEHVDRDGLLILRNCTFCHTSTSVNFQHRRSCREEKVLSQTPVSLVWLFVALLEERDFFRLWAAIKTLSQDSGNYTPGLLFKFHFSLWANAAASL